MTKEKPLSEKIKEIRKELYSYSAEICLNEVECDLKEAVEKLKRLIFRIVSPVCTTEYACSECLNKEIDKIFGDFK